MLAGFAKTIALDPYMLFYKEDGPLIMHAVKIAGRALASRCKAQISEVRVKNTTPDLNIGGLGTKHINLTAH